MRSLSVARGPSSKLNRKEHELVLIEARPYAIWLIAGARLVTEEGCHPGLSDISKSWKTLYCLAVLATGSVPRQGLIMDYMIFYVPWMAMIIKCIFLPIYCVDHTIRYNT